MGTVTGGSTPSLHSQIMGTEHQEILTNALAGPYQQAIRKEETESQVAYRPVEQKAASLNTLGRAGRRA
jgi:hypothetical protein